MRNSADEPRLLDAGARRLVRSASTLTTARALIARVRDAAGDAARRRLVTEKEPRRDGRAEGYVDLSAWDRRER
jgi:hypothetical protein